MVVKIWNYLMLHMGVITYEIAYAFHMTNGMNDMVWHKVHCMHGM